MKKKLLALSNLILLIVLTALCLTACDKEITFPKNIFYLGSNDMMSLEVNTGDSYNIPHIPEKEGYIFYGWYNSEDGGVQYTDEKGVSLIPFQDEESVVLFPHFIPETITVELVVDDEIKSMNPNFTEDNIVTLYNSEIFDLPKQFNSGYKEFDGWYTQPFGAGNKIADKYGIIPGKNTLNIDNYEFDFPSNKIFLYANFVDVNCEVLFYFNDNNYSLRNISKGTNIKTLSYDETYYGRKVQTWSLKKDDINLQYVFDGVIDKDITLYASSYIPRIYFNTKNNLGIDYIEKEVGREITMPTPTSVDQKFDCWVDEHGNEFKATTMPKEDIYLSARWCPTIIFKIDENNNCGSITDKPGTVIDIPIPAEHNGRIFNCWIDSNGVEYTSKVMSDEDITLMAKWCPIITLDIGDGEKLEGISKMPGSIVEIPTPAKHNGRTFNCWLDSNGVEYTSKVMPDDDITLMAKWFPLITLDIGDGEKMEGISEMPGSIIELPVPIKQRGDKFNCWVDSNGSKYTSTLMPNKDITLKAKWYPGIILDLGNGEPEDYVSDIPGKEVTLPIPTVRGEKFMCWVDLNGKEYKTIIVPEETITLRAKWCPKIYFDAYGLDPIPATPGDTVKLPTYQKSGERFYCWKDNIGNKYNSIVMPEIDVRLMPVWCPKVIMIHETGYSEKAIVNPNSDFELQNLPNNGDCVFAGWFDRAGNEIYKNVVHVSFDDVVVKAGYYGYDTMTYNVTMNGAINRINLDENIRYTTYYANILSANPVGKYVNYTFSIEMRADTAYDATGGMTIYNEHDEGNRNHRVGEMEKILDSNWHTYTFTTKYSAWCGDMIIECYGYTDSYNPQTMYYRNIKCSVDYINQYKVIYL